MGPGPSPGPTLGRPDASPCKAEGGGGRLGLCPMTFRISEAWWSILRWKRLLAQRQIRVL